MIVTGIPAMRLIYLALVLVFAPASQRIRGTVEPLQPPHARLAPGLRVQLRTRDGRSEFHLYESIPIEVRVSSSQEKAYSIELDLGWNAVAGDVEFLVSPGDAVIKRRQGNGFVCCSSRR